MFPPDSGGLNPTRVPYEESSIYSKLNFFSPKNLDAFKSMIYNIFHIINVYIYK